MASSVYSEVTSVSTYGYEQDRVLDSLKTPSDNLPYTVEDITISHNDFAVSDVYNDSIRKLYRNYLYLIANAEMLTTMPPTSAPSNYITVRNNGVAALTATLSAPSVSRGNVGDTGTYSLSNLQEVHISSKTDDSGSFTLFTYSPDNSFILEADENITSVTTLVSGNEVEFNKSFKFKNVVSVDTVDNFLFVLDKDANTAFKFDISGLITNDPALKRTSIRDEKHPGRYLLKTIGGEGISQTKNKLSNPNSLSIYKNRIYILDNGHNSVKVFDLDFNFIHEIFSPENFNSLNNGELVSIVVDQYSNTNEAIYGYILSSKGKIIEYDVENNSFGPAQDLFNFYDTKLYTLSGLDEVNSFNKIVNSKAQKNILYISNNAKIYKYYKSNLNQYLGVLNLSGGGTGFNFHNSGLNISGKEKDLQIMSFDTALYRDIDYIAVTTRVNSISSKVAIPAHSQVATYIYEDEHTTTKLYNENFYTNYFTLSDILVLPQEIVNNITFNKTTKKLIYNHYSLFENLARKVYSYYSSETGSAAVPTLCSVNEHAFTKPSSFEDSANLYIGVNEPLLTDVINRPLRLLYSQQESLFDLIKEHTLNTNPPSGISVYLPGNTADFPNIIGVDSTTATISAGGIININLTKTNLLSTQPSCSFKFYTTLGTALSSDFSYIDAGNKSIKVFTKDETSKTISLNTASFFKGASKTFDLVLEQNTNCLIDPDKSKTTITINPVGDIYNISLGAATLDIKEGSTGRVEIKRTPITAGIDNVLRDVNASVNIKIEPNANITTSLYTPNVSGSTTYNTVSSKTLDLAGVNNGTEPYQLSAYQVGSTSTIFFTDQITSVVFDISAVNTLSETSDAQLDVIISNPSDGSVISGIEKQVVTVDEEYKTATLFLSAISGSYRADTTSNTLLSCVNVWEALSANETYKALSATNPFIVDFTVNTPLSVFSVSTVSAAIQIDPINNEMVYSSNKLYLNVESDTAIVGKGGRGGHGAVWHSGSDFSESGDISATHHMGEDGGPAIGNLDTYFSTISVNNSGLIFGGGGGGAGGNLPLSASTDASVQKLSGGSGGGGGAGIHTTNKGLGGLAALGSYGVETEAFTQDSNFQDVFILNGGIGAGNVGSIGGYKAGAGGGFASFVNATNTYSVVDSGGINQSVLTMLPMSGLDGGELGLAGASDSLTVPVIQSTLPAADLGSSFSTVSGEYGIRIGGKAGWVVESNKQVLSSGDGQYVGLSPGQVGNIQTSS